MLCQFKIRKADFFFPRPSSPWTTIGIVRRKLISPDLARSKTGWEGNCNSKFVHQACQMSLCRLASGFTKPQRRWRQLWVARNIIQSLILKKGILREPSLVSRKVFGSGRDICICFASKLWQSRSPLLVRFLESWRSPSDWELTAAAPKSATTSRAVLMTAAQEALANAKASITQVYGYEWYLMLSTWWPKGFYMCGLFI